MIYFKKLTKRSFNWIVFSGIVFLTFYCSPEKTGIESTSAKDTLQYLALNDEYSDFNTNIFLTSSGDTLTPVVTQDFLIRDDMVTASIREEDVTPEGHPDSHYKQAWISNVEIIKAKPFMSSAKMVANNIDAWVAKLEKSKMQKIEYTITLNRRDMYQSKKYTVNKGINNSDYFFLVSEYWHPYEGTTLLQLTYYFDSSGKLCRMDEFIIEKSTWRSERTSHYYFENGVPFWKSESLLYKVDVSKSEDRISPDDEYVNHELFMDRKSVEETIMKLIDDTYNPYQ